MGFSDHSPRTYFYDKAGKFVIGSEKKGNLTTHDTFTGFLKGIRYIETQREFQQGKPVTVKQWVINFVDDNLSSLNKNFLSISSVI